jgi:EmrB/QacA subfamily drug resistance transporter
MLACNFVVPHEDHWGIMMSEATGRSRWVALYVLCIGMLMIVLDITVVNVALPSIRTDLEFTPSSLAWVVNAYLIAFGGLLLLAGRFGDLVGRRSVFLAGLGVFTVASLLCGLAQTQWMLVGARFLQGIGGAMASAVLLGIIVTMFPEPREQAKAIGVYSFVASAGGAIGLLAGGVLTQAINWHWIFFVNVPIGIATMALAGRLLAKERGIGLRNGADVPGAVLITAALMLAVYTIVEPAAQRGWSDGRTLLLGGLSLGLLAAFLIREATARQPLVPLRIFRSRNVAGSNLILALMVSAMFSAFFLGSLYLERVLHYDALQIGLAFLPVTIVMAVLAGRYSERLIMRFGARTVLFPALSTLIVALALFARAPVGGDYLVDLLPAMILFGTGAGLSFPALMTLGMSGATNEDAGLASGLINTTGQVGASLGLAVLATLAATRTANLAGGAEPSPADLTSGYQLSFWVGAGLLAGGILIGATVLRAPAQAPEPELEPAYAEAS